MNHKFQSVYTCAGVSPTSRVCIECLVGFYKLGNKCVTTCPMQYYGYVEIVPSHKTNTNKTVATCRKCHPACNKCKGGKNSDCFECSSDYILQSRQCIPKEFIEFMSPRKFLIWSASVAFMLILFYGAYKLCKQYLKQQEKQSIRQQTPQEMSLHSSPPSPLQQAWSPCNQPHQPAEQ